jgi:hypothetical protein
MQYLKMNLASDPTSPDSPPKQLHVGAINPYALCEVILGQPINRGSVSSAHIMSTVLQMDYDELFDMKYGSVIYAGLKFNAKSNCAERLSEKDMHVLTEDDLVTPDMSKITKINDLTHIGMEHVGDTPVKLAWVQNGQLRLVLHSEKLFRTLSNHAITQSLRDTTTPFRKETRDWTPPNCTWETPTDIARRIQQFHDLHGIEGGGMERSLVSGLRQTFQSATMMGREYDNPVQGALGDSWLVAALFAVAWSDPFAINRDVQVTKPEEKHKDRTFSVKLHSKGGDNDAATSTVQVSYDIPLNNSTNMPVFCQPSGSLSVVWPSLYEKAFAKWITGGSSDHPDITQLSASAAGGDPVKAMAQITNGKPQYYFTHSRSAADLMGLVRANSVNFKCIRPMVAYTHASGHMYKGSNMVANHAYTVLGWAFPGGSKQYLVVRNPWGVTEPKGMTSYFGLLESIDPTFWPPAHLVDSRGVFAIEASAFKECFACLGMCK